MDSLLSTIKNDINFLATYNEGIRLLEISRVDKALREVGKLRLVSPAIPNYAEVQMARANYCTGYSDALDDLFMFKQRFLETNDKIEPSKTLMDFGGLDRAVKLGLITEEERRNLNGSN